MMVYKIITALCVIAGLVFLWKSFKLHDKWTRLSKKGKYSLIIVLCGLILFSNIWAILGVAIGIGLILKVFMNSGGGMVFYRDDGVSKPGWYDEDGYKVSD
ncbi:hypothetical protein [Gallibacterium anatis]|uniref:Uncharacterized protein n=2 Tax=Gallibacterium anatis TaxID=750 RepID=U1GJN9_9PAST|nr:hypothetical protein [Gallibacterium anatis]ERF77882.1 hypothetical protein N561_09135 [Gallibacterium anatis 12656/12]KGQ47064.1 hypothetical protein JL04_11600 [Gallibacterium anatis]HJF73555.1 hypothetical protein [Gallibacterium anatis]